MGDFLRTGDDRPYRAFLARWMAAVVGDGAPPTALFSSLRTLCEEAVELAETGGDELALAVARLHLASARILVEVLAREHRRTLRLSAEL